MAQMTAQAINDLPDSAFAYIEPGGTKDASGKTTPRSKRHFPIHDAEHVRNALARAPQSPFGKRAMAKILAAAKRLGVQASAGRSLDDIGVEHVMDTVERRYTPVTVEIRQADRRRIGGYAAVFGKLSRNLGGFVERVEPVFFDECRAAGWPDAMCRYNHDDNMLLGTSPHTLALEVNRTGLQYAVEVPKARDDILELVERGDVKKSSFAFVKRSDEWTTSDQGFPMRSLVAGDLVDVAPVNKPAYEDTSAGLRSLAEFVGADLEEVRSAAQADGLRRFLVRTDIDGGKPAKPKAMFGPAALALLQTKADPWAE